MHSTKSRPDFQNYGMAAGGHATITGLRIKKEPEEEEKIRTHTEQVQENVRTPSVKVEPKLENPATDKKNPKQRDPSHQ